MKFYDRVKEICDKYERVAMFVDMDGTIVEFTIYPDGYITTELKGAFVDGEPVKPVINSLEELNRIENLDIYILSLSRSNIIYNEKKIWLKKYAPFIEEKNYIILIKENGDYTSENRNHIKSDKIREKLNEYDYTLFLDDDHAILKTAQKELEGKCTPFHVTSALV